MSGKYIFPWADYHDASDVWKRWHWTAVLSEEWTLCEKSQNSIFYIITYISKTPLSLTAACFFMSFLSPTAAAKDDPLIILHARSWFSVNRFLTSLLGAEVSDAVWEQKTVPINDITDEVTPAWDRVMNDIRCKVRWVCVSVFAL